MTPRPSSPPEEIRRRFEEYRRTGSEALRNRLVEEHRSVAEAIARRFAGRGEPLDDLEQVATIGLIKSVERYDPSTNVPFVGFAVPTITGELRRHFRDRTWVLKVSRRAKDLYVQLPAAIERLNVELGRQPTPAELAASLDRTLDEVLDALDAEGAYRPLSTDADDGVRSVADLSATTESTADDRLLVSSMLAQLPEREREIVALRYFEDLSQSEIAERVGVSQVHVSRLLRRALLLMRPDEVEPADVP